MLYAKLVARIAEVSRALVARGRSGTFTQNSTIFLAEAVVPYPQDAQGAWLKIMTGTSRGVYRVLRISGNELHVDDPFLSTEQDVGWELYDEGVDEDSVRKVLRYFPEVVMECDEGEQVKTHLGVIKIVRRKRKRVKDPQGRWTFSPERLQARLRPGKQLQKLVEDDASELPTSPQGEPEDEDL